MNVAISVTVPVVVSVGAVEPDHLTIEGQVTVLEPVPSCAKYNVNLTRLPFNTLGAVIPNTQFPVNVHDWYAPLFQSIVVAVDVLP